MGEAAKNRRKGQNRRFWGAKTPEAEVKPAKRRGKNKKRTSQMRGSEDLERKTGLGPATIAQILLDVIQYFILRLVFDLVLAVTKICKIH